MIHINQALWDMVQDELAASNARLGKQNYARLQAQGEAFALDNREINAEFVREGIASKFAKLYKRLDNQADQLQGRLFDADPGELRGTVLLGDGRRVVLSRMVRDEHRMSVDLSNANESAVVKKAGRIRYEYTMLHPYYITAETTLAEALAAFHADQTKQVAAARTEFEALPDRADEEAAEPVPA